MIINRQVNKGITKEEYFSNNGKGYDSPHVIRIKDLNIRVEVYSHNLRASKIAKVESEIRETAADFTDAFGLECSKSEQTFKIYVFDDKADYTHLGGSENFGSLLGDEGGKCYYRGQSDIFAEMYVYQQGGVHNLQHEFTHGLTYLATGGKSLPTVLMEGIADYFEHHSDHKFHAQGSSIDRTEAANLNLKQILGLKYSSNSEENSLVYKTGQALVMYLQEKDPQLLSDYLSAVRADNTIESQSLLSQIMQHNDEFKSWLVSNNTENAMREINALQVTKGEYIATKKEIVDGEIKDVHSYRAEIKTMDGGEVGSFSPVEHIAFYGTIRAINRATNDTLDISKREYSFLKVVSTSGGQNKLVYSDKDGNEYKDSQEYKLQALRILSKYGEDLEKSYRVEEEGLREEYHGKSSELDQLKDIEYEEKLGSYNEGKSVQLLDIHGRYSRGEISYQDYVKEYHLINANYRNETDGLWNSLQDKYTKLKSALPGEYEKAKNSLLDKMIKTGLEQVKATKSIDVEKILEELVNIDPNLIRSKGSIDLQEGQILSIQALGQGNRGALSVYDGNTKLGELLSEAGFFKQVEGSTKDTFIFEDILHNLNVRYEGSAYMAVTKEGGQYKASLIDGRKVESDEYFDEAHLHENELLHPSIGHIQKDLDSLLLRGTKILSHQDSKHAQYSDEQRKSGVIIEKGKLLDNKGTDRTDDDVHEAVVKQGGETLHAFKNMGFYITEEVKNERGEVINGSNLFIHDHGKNVRYQLPEKITHLKLVQKEGQYKLAPSDERGIQYMYDSRGNEIPEEYRYIDPIFAHEYEKRDYSHKHVNVGLINLEKYNTGKLFAIKHDPNDYHIRKNSSGEIVRIKGQTYFTKVKLFDGDEEIGMLSNNFHNFKGKIFFSADYNYSYNDFLASVSPQVEVEDREDGSKKITFDQSKGDIGDTNRGYTDYQRIFTKGKQTETLEGQSETKVGVDTSHISHSITNAVVQTTEEKTRSSSHREDEMQSDQPQSLTRTKRSSLVEEKEQEKIVLKDTILKIEKSYNQDSEGKHKANLTIDYNDIKALYDRAEGEDKGSVLKFWHKLHASNYKVGALSEEKYYFKDGKFMIHDSDAKKLVVLPADKISIKIMKLGGDYDLVITDQNGRVISAVSRVDNLNYELLSDASGFSLETMDSIELSDPHSEYDSYLISGLGGKMFDCPSYHNHDHNLI